jgi:hypothetical protein
LATLADAVSRTRNVNSYGRDLIVEDTGVSINSVQNDTGVG